MLHIQWLSLLSCWALFCMNSPIFADPPERIAGRSLIEYGEQLDDPDRVVRLRAVRSLGALGSQAGAALTKALDHDDPAVRYIAAESLGRAGGDSLQQATGQLESLAADPRSLAVQMASSFALCRGGNCQQHLPLLIKALKHPSRGIACSAAELIGQIGPLAAAAIEPLTLAFQNNRPGTRVGDYHLGGAAQNALRKVRQTESSP